MKSPSPLADSIRPALVAAAVLLVASLGSCSSDDGDDAGYGDDVGASSAVDGELVSDPGGRRDTAEEDLPTSGILDAALPVSARDAGAAPASPDADLPDSAEDEGAGPAAPDADLPGPGGGLGEACRPDGSCTQGSCETLPGAGQPICTRACLSNYDCPESLRCEAISAEQMRCLPGSRGNAALGQPCGAAKGNGCRSGLCVDADPSANIPADTCTEPCAADSDCEVPFPVCFGMVQLCLPIASGYLGGRCKADGTCFEGQCLAVASSGQRCTRSCARDADCGAPYLASASDGAGSVCLMRR